MFNSRKSSSKWDELSKSSFPQSDISQDLLPSSNSGHLSFSNKVHDFLTTPNLSIASRIDTSSFDSFVSHNNFMQNNSAALTSISFIGTSGNGVTKKISDMAAYDFTTTPFGRMSHAGLAPISLIKTELQCSGILESATLGLARDKLADSVDRALNKPLGKIINVVTDIIEIKEMQKFRKQELINAGVDEKVAQTCSIVGTGGEVVSKFIGVAGVSLAASRMRTRTKRAAIWGAGAVVIEGGSRVVGDGLQNVCVSTANVFQNQPMTSISTTKFKDKSLQLLESILLPATAEAKEVIPVCKRPTFEFASKEFFKVAGYGNFSNLGELIGGKVKYNFDKGIFNHGCAIRGSFVINQAAVNSGQLHCAIPRIKNETVSGADGKQYAPRLNTLIKVIIEKYGQPEYDGRKKNQQRPQKIHGIVIELRPDGTRFSEAQYHFTGHFDIINRIPYDENYIYWELPYEKLEKDITPSTPSLRRYEQLLDRPEFHQLETDLIRGYESMGLRSSLNNSSTLFSNPRNKLSAALSLADKATPTILRA